MARRIPLAGTVKVLSAQASDAGTATGLTVVAADAAKIPHIHGVLLSTNTAGDYSIRIGTTVMAKLHLAANSEVYYPLYPFYWANNAVNESINVVKPQAATTSVTVFYTLEPSR